MKKNLIFLITFAVLAIVSISLFAYQKSDVSPKKQTQPENLTAEEALTKLSNKLEVKSELRDSNFWNWIESENKSYPLKGKEIFIGTININGVGKFGKIETGQIEKVTLDYLNEIKTQLDDFYQKTGFVKSAQNSFDKEPDEFGNLFVGYERDELKCLGRLTVQSDPFGSFFCGNVDQDQVQKMEQFVALFAPNLNSRSLLRVQKIEGDFALGNFAEGLGPGGYTWMAKRVNNNWQIVWKGTEIALCSEMKKYSIPESIYGSCYPQ